MESIVDNYDVINNKTNTVQTKGNSNRGHKRDVRDLRPNNTCTLFLQSDPQFWDHYLNKSEGDREVARQEILWSFASHVQAVNNILDNTSFQTINETIGYFGLRLAIAKTKIMTEEVCQDPSPSPYCKPNMDIYNFHEILSKENHTLFCLAYAFTYRDFSGGILGNAWVAHPGTSGGSGGICEKFKKYSEDGHVVYKSYNTGIITTELWGRAVLNSIPS